MKYILTSEKVNGSIEIGYENGYLNLFKLDLNAPLNEKQLEAISDRLGLANLEIDLISAFSDIGLKASKVMATNEKIAMWCRLYEVYVGTKYIVSPADSGKIKNLKLDEAILFYYFTSQNFLFKSKYSISNLTKYYNELIAEIANTGKGKHPDQWSLEYENKLDQQGRSEYWAHLRSKGLIAKKDRLGRTIDWIKSV
ncbi:MAG: hypothetical protein V4663_06050 [Bacteroidota bacterium]